MKTIKLYHFEPEVTVLGPGIRCVIWLQGCNFKCPGCLAPDSHNPDEGEEIDIDCLSEKIFLKKNIEGITISGGEPFFQYENLKMLISQIKKTRPELSVIIYTGYIFEELLDMKNNDINSILDNTDIIIDGKYIKELSFRDPWRGSSNQSIHFLTNRYSINDYKNSSANSLEFKVGRDGKFFIIGIPYEDIIEKIDKSLKEKGIFIRY